MNTKYEARYEARVSDWSIGVRHRLQCGKHLHPHVELVIMLEGASSVWADGKGGVLHAGEAFVAFPNQVHSCEDDQGPFTAVCAIFSPDIFPAYYKTFSKKLPAQPVAPLSLSLAQPLVTLMNNELHTEDKYARIIAENCLSILLGYLFRGMDLQPIPERDIGSIRLILDYCNRNYHHDITLEDIAAETHLSKYYISHTFGKEIGVRLPQYISSLRVQEARGLLKTSDMSVTDVAYAVGFNSLRSFNRWFLQLEGLPPGEYKRQAEQERPGEELPPAALSKPPAPATPSPAYYEEGCLCP